MNDMTGALYDRTYMKQTCRESVAIRFARCAERPKAERRPALAQTVITPAIYALGKPRQASELPSQPYPRMPTLLEILQQQAAATLGPKISQQPQDIPPRSPPTGGT